MIDTYKFSESYVLNMSQNKEFDRNKAKLTQWLAEDGYKIQEIPDPNAQFRIVAEHQLGIKIELIHPQNMKDKIILAAGVSLTDDRKQKLAAMEHEKKLSLFWDLRFTLLKAGIQFTSLDYTSTQYGLQNLVYYDGLNKNIFMREFHHLQDMVVFMLMTFDKQFGQPEPSQDLGMFG